MHLLQPVGGQVWPNFLPVLAFDPSRVTFLTSADPKGTFRGSVTHLADACEAAGHPFDCHIIRTETLHPSITECSRALAGTRVDLINLTGGSKPMSIAAHAHASSTSTPSFYLDTRRESAPFEITNTAPFKLPIPSLGQLSAEISVRIALMAQGFAVPDSFETPAPEEMNFSKQAARIRQDPAADKMISAQLSQLRSQFLSPTNGRMYKGGKLRGALQIPIRSEPGTPFHSYLLAAAEQDIIEEHQPGVEFLLTRLDPTTTKADTLRSVAANNFKLLEGVWFELALLDHLEHRSPFSDICWNVEADCANAGSIGETDLVAFDPHSFTLHFISCKTTGPHGNALDHIQGLRRRATKEGGRFSRADLWIFSPKSPESKQTLLSHCEEQDVSLHIFTEEVILE